ncbi:hypothetical protein [Marinobacter sp. ELB17]|uniref:hypothetical protein n=1 Tax=Marinobacter sp. ELB17 TaxID=270374 RepID=UPI0000F3ABC3|nr:hypothetical protein [Marinobacter sp. ELB17]EAZ97169.1 hypothetical protein MELB17_11073 [Marinobacter sp. ELB17]
MEFVLFLFGAILSWLITHIYYRQSSKTAPEWAQPLIDSLPATQPSQDELLKLVQNHVNHNSIIESGSNSDGEWFRYGNGDQVCKGQFEVGDENEVRIPFPSEFATEPSLDLSGNVNRIKTKRATQRELLVELNSGCVAESISEFQYQARGHWKDPHSQ